MKNNKTQDARRRRTLLTALAITTISCAALADPVTDFYKGRTVTVVISGSTGSTYDVGTRLIAKYMSRHIPGCSRRSCRSR